MTMKSRATRVINRLAGYFGLFLIGLIGWYCDQFGRSGLRARPTPHLDSGMRQVGRFVD
jgi:hypothetical protein